MELVNRINANSALSTRVVAQQKDDSVLLAYQKYNTVIAMQVRPTSSVEPSTDGLSYNVDGTPQLFCRPYVKVSYLGEPFPGPNVRFVQVDGELHLRVSFEEDPALRIANSVPFTVSVGSVQLKYGPAPDQLLTFDSPAQTPNASGDLSISAFSITADAKIPVDKADVIIHAMKTPDTAQWIVTLQFDWTQLVPQSQPPPTPIVVRPYPIRPIYVLPNKIRPFAAAADAPPLAALNVQSVMRQQEVLHSIVNIVRTPPPPPPVPITKTITIVRALPASYPKETAYNRPIYSAVDQDYTLVPWRTSKADNSSGSTGYYLPTPVMDVVYCTPDAYRLKVDPDSGRPAIELILLSGTEASNDPQQYKVRCTMQVVPDFDPVRLDTLRATLRNQYGIVFAQLMMGGYQGASFVADGSLANIGQMFAGHSADDKPLIDPINGFSVTYEGNTEFLGFLLDRLRKTEIGGQVVLQLSQPGDQPFSLPIPVSLTTRNLAPMSPVWKTSTLSVPAADPPTPTPASAILEVQNTAQLPMKLDDVQCSALQIGLHGAVTDWSKAVPTRTTFPATIESGGKLIVTLQAADADLVANGWNIALVDPKPVPDSDALLNMILDGATQGVKAWKIDIDCPPLRFFDQLSADQQAAFKDVIAVDVELRRTAPTDASGQPVAAPSETAHLTKAQPGGSALLSRTVSDFVADRAGAANAFYYRRRLIHINRQDDWASWQQGSGSALSVYFAS